MDKNNCLVGAYVLYLHPDKYSVVFMSLYSLYPFLFITFFIHNLQL